MAKLTAAEKQIIYRQRRDADPERRAAYLEKRKGGYVKDIQTKKRKKISDKSAREKRSERKAWQVRQARCRQRRRAGALTPPSSPDRSPSISRQLQEGRRVRRKDAQRKQREIQKLKDELIVCKRKCEKLKKRNTRLQCANLNSPGAKTREILQGQQVNPPVRKALKFHFAILGALKQKYKALKETKSKQNLAQLLSEKMIKKYRCRTYCKKSIGCASRTLRTPKQVQVAKTQKETVRQFYLRDDVSRLTTGKKNTLTLRKVKKQRRLLCDSLLNLHKKFVAELQHISYAFFCRQRPFWVVTPNEKDRETCQCKTHENLQFMADRLYRLGISNSKNPVEMSDSTVCNTSKLCAYGECVDCKQTTYPLTKSTNTVVTLTQWCQEKVDYSKPGEETRMSTITVKKDVPIQEDELVAQFQDRLFKFRRHIFNIRWQYNAYRNLRENLTAKDCLIHIDFSENYTGKYSNEIQSVHFGGSHQQLKESSKVKLFYVSEEEVEKKDESLHQVPLFTVKGTMKMHQVLSISPGILKYRDISCFCQAAEGVFDCSCHSLQEVSLVATEHAEKALDVRPDVRPDVIKHHHSGQWCVVRYDDQPYPGIILEVEEHNVKVKCMHRNGINRFFWPSPREDVNWYGDDQIMCLIPEPLALNKRSVQIEQELWEFIMGQLDNN
ncbi:hypothetical protein KUCAC02_031890 [Chaenocephalus aceratus]|nr:hypothetical protein KUCAC02_031890 [Chaenocephalus aceratus]